MNIENQNKKYKSSGHTIYSCQYHVIFCPKYRRKILINGIDTRLKEIINGLQKKYQFEVLEMEIMPDHVHLLLDINPLFGIETVLKKIRGTSAYLLRKEFPELKKKLPCLWTRSKFVSSVGSVSLETVKQYIENQKNK